MELTTKDLMAALRANEDDAVEKTGAMQLMDTDILLAAAKGVLDLNEVAAHLVACRGIGKDGKWVGFDEAERQMAELAERRRQ